MFKKKKKAVEEILPKANDEVEESEEEDTGKYDAKIAELNAKLRELDQKATKAIKKDKEQVGEFGLDLSEMTLFVQLCANSEEYKVYSQWTIGRKMAELIREYNKAIKQGEKDEVQNNPDEEGLL